MLDLDKYPQSRYNGETGTKRSSSGNPADIWKDLSRAIFHGDIDEAIRAHDAMPREDYIWHLSGANDIVETLAQEPGRADSHVMREAQARIVDDATNLAVSRLAPEDIGNLGLGSRYFDDAGIDRPPELKDALLLGRSWDNTNRHPLVGELFARIVLQLEPSAVEEITLAFQTALEDDTLTFHEACLRAYAKYNDFTLREVGAIVSPSVYPKTVSNKELESLKQPSLDAAIVGAQLTK